MTELNDIVLRLYGRAKFCFDTGEIKSHDLFKEAAREIEFLKEELENQEDLNDMYRDENKELREALQEIYTLKLCLTMLVEKGLNDPTVNEFILAALQQKDSGR